ncbi:MAG: hypothetical protein WCO26_12525 [Deltaproteobacteria bacterium]
MKKIVCKNPTGQAVKNLPVRVKITPPHWAFFVKNIPTKKVLRRFEEGFIGMKKGAKVNFALTLSKILIHF